MTDIPIHPVRAHNARRANPGVIIQVFGLGALVCSFAHGSPPARNHLGATLVVVSRGSPSTVDIKLRPTVAYETVTVELGSGVAAITPACAFNAVESGGSYTCRLVVTGTSKDPSLTVNVVGHRATDPATQRHVEVASLTMFNPSFIRTKKATATKIEPSLISSSDRTKPL